MEIIGLSGYARSGKDTVADIMVEHLGFTKVAFADKLREFIYSINPIVHNDGTLLQDVVDRHGWGGYKGTEYGTEIRRLLQRLGTEAGRQVLGDNVWIDAMFNDLPEDSKVVVSDARFINEFDAIVKRGGKVWRIHRPGVGPANEHASELEAIEYDNFALYLHNNSTSGALRKAVISAYKSNRDVGVIRAVDYKWGT